MEDMVKMIKIIINELKKKKNVNLRLLVALRGLFGPRFNKKHVNLRLLVALRGRFGPNF